MTPTPTSGPPRGHEPADRTKALLFVLVALLAVGVVALALVLALGGDGDDGAAPSPRPTATPTSTTWTGPAPTATATATGSATLPPDEARSVVWPRPGGAVYRDPVEAAVTMAMELVGFTTPVVGEYQAGDSRSGEVPIRAKSTGPVTTVQVRQLSDGYWYVLGAATDDLRLESPQAGATISSPVPVSGQSRAFEGAIVVSVHAQADHDPLGQESLMGGANADLGPFTGEIPFDAPDDDGPGAIIITTHSAQDGRIRQATVVPVVLRAD